MKRFRKVLIVLLAILVPVSIGFGYNFFNWNDSKELNKEAMTVEGKLSIDDLANIKNLVPGDKICDSLTMNITSSTVSLLRVKVNVYCADSETAETDIAPIKNAGDNWLKGSDGYYYYTQGVKNGDIVKLAEDGIYFNGLNDNVDMNKYQGKKIKVVANAELVQAKHGVFADKWGLSKSNNADIYTTLKSISDAQGK
nr:hypothetical protein [uncultured Intestinibacter sp.]